MLNKRLRQSAGSALRFVCLSMVAWAGASGAALAEEATAVRTIGMLELTSGGTGTSTFYVSSDIGWGAASCAGANWAYFYSNINNAKELFALLMYAKQMGKQVQLVGTCTSLDYFQLVQVVVAG